MAPAGGDGYIGSPSGARMHAYSLALALAASAALTPTDLDRAARAFAVAHPGAVLVPAANGGLEHASRLVVARRDPDDEANARAFLQEEGKAFGVTSSQDLRALRVWSAGSAGGVALFERAIEGRPVFGGRVAVGWRGDGTITTANGARVLAADPHGSFLVSGAQALAAAFAGARGTPGTSSVSEGWLQFEGTLQPVFRVEHETSDPVDSLVTYVEADTGNVLYRFSRRRSAVPLSPCGPCLAPPCICTFRDSPVTPPPVPGALVNAPEPLPARDLEPPGDRLTGRRTAAYGCLGAEGSAVACTTQSATLQGGGFLAPPDSTMRRIDDAFAEQSAYFHIDDHSRFLDSLDDACLATPAAPGAPPRCFAERTTAGGVGFIPGYVNALSKGQPLANAYFTSAAGSSGTTTGFMIFGQGSLVDLAYDAEIVYHELTHAAVDVTSAFEEFTDRFGPNADPGALNEGTADTFSVAHAAETIGGGDISASACMSRYFALSAGEQCLRNAANVRTCQGNGPNDGRDPGRTGEVHDDGEIWTGFTWSLLQAANDHGLRPQVAKALFRALETVGSHPTFLGYAGTARQAMVDAGLPQEALDFTDCTIEQRDLGGCSERSVALFSGERAQGGFFGPSSGGTAAAAQQYFVDVPCGAVALRVQSGDATGHGSLYVRKGAPVEFTAPGLGSPAYDWILPANRAEAVLDATGCPSCACSGARAAFGPGRWYFLPSGAAKDAGDQTNSFEIAVSIDMSPGHTPPRRVPYTFTPGASDPSGPNVCIWGVTGAVPAQRAPRSPSSVPSGAGCSTSAAPSAALVCGVELSSSSGGRGGCSTLGPDGGLLVAAALFALHRRYRRRTSRVGARD